MRSSENGFTVVEIIVALFIAGILATVAIGVFGNKDDAATTVRCAANMRAISTDLESFWEQAHRYPTEDEYLEDDGNRFRHISGIHYIVDGDPNSGHGNDIDGCDEDNPGKSSKNRDCRDIKWVLFCDHNHGDVAARVFLADDSVPTLVLDGREKPLGLTDLPWVETDPWDFERFSR